MKKFIIQALPMILIVVIIGSLFVTFTPKNYPHKKLIGDYNFKYKVKRADFRVIESEEVAEIETFVSILTDQIVVDGIHIQMGRYYSYDSQTVDDKLHETFIFLNGRRYISLHSVDSRIESISIINADKEFVSFNKDLTTFKNI